MFKKPFAMDYDLMVKKFLLKNFKGCFEEGIDYSGGDVHDQTYPHTESPLDCQRLCQKDAKCFFWTWTKPTHHDPNICYFKSKIANRTNDYNTISGPKFCDGKWNAPKCYLMKC